MQISYPHHHTSHKPTTPFRTAPPNISTNRHTWLTDKIDQQGRIGRADGKLLSGVLRHSTAPTPACNYTSAATSDANWGAMALVRGNVIPGYPREDTRSGHFNSFADACTSTHLEACRMPVRTARISTAPEIHSLRHLRANKVDFATYPRPPFTLWACNLWVVPTPAV